MVELNSEFITKTVFPRVIKAALWGLLTYIIVYYVPLMILSSDMFPLDYGVALLDFALISVFFVVAGQLFSGTIIGCGIGIARALVLITYFFTIADGGIFSLVLPIEDVSIELTVDITVILLMIVSVNLFDIAKNLLEAISLLTENSTKLNLDEV